MDRSASYKWDVIETENDIRSIPRNYFNELSDMEKKIVDKFFENFPYKGLIGEQIALQPGEDWAFTTIVFFSNKSNSMKFMRNRSDINVAVPYAYFHGYFHPDYPNCLVGVRTGNPIDPMYKYSYEIPKQRETTMRNSFQKGRIPCPLCYEQEIQDLIKHGKQDSAS